MQQIKGFNREYIEIADRDDDILFYDEFMDRRGARCRRRGGSLKLSKSKSAILTVSLSAKKGKYYIKNSVKKHSIYNQRTKNRAYGCRNQRDAYNDKELNG